MNSDVLSTGSTYDLQDNTLTFQASFPYIREDTTGTRFYDNITFYTTVVNETKFGKVVVNGTDGYVTFEDMNHMDLKLRGNTTTLPPASGRDYVVFGTVTNGGILTIPTDDQVTLVKLPGGNLFVNWSYSNGVIHEVAKPQSEINQILTDLINEAGGRPTTVVNVINIVNPNNTGQAAALGSAVIQAANTGNLVEAVNRLEPVVVEATQASYLAAAEATKTVSDRASSVSAPARFNMAMQESEGVSAGIKDDELKYGAWGSTYYSTALQRGDYQGPGYKTTTFGGAIGADTLVNDTTMVGVAFSVMKLKINHRDSNSGDKTTANGYLFSVYGLKELTEKWFVQAVLSVGTNKIDNRERRLQGSIYEIARGSYTASNYGMEVLAGYDRALGDYMMLTPIVGFAYNWLADSWYQERGTTSQNFLITRKADKKFEAIGGARLSFAREWKDMTITPEVHGLLRYAVVNLSPAIDVRIQGLTDPYIPRTVEPRRFFTNLGFGVSIAKGRMNYGLSYDSYLGKKYVGHQGTLKMRLNF